MNIVQLYPKIGTRPINHERVDTAQKSIVHEMNKDQDEDVCAENIKTVYNDLTNDEQVFLNNLLKGVKIDCQNGERQANTLLKEYLDL